MKESNKQFDDVKASLHTEALKLADELEEFYVDPDGFPYMINESATMIRRLVEELDKQGEPFAWTDKEEMQRAKRHNCFLAWTKSYPIEKVIIPLYTTPQTKPLPTTVEEVIAFIGTNFNRSNFFEFDDGTEESVYELTIHDLLSAFENWENFAPQTKPEDIWTSCLDCGQRVTGDSIHTCSPQTKKSEPVVYWDGKHFASKEKSSLADIPLYTTPQTKPLSDEEILEIIRHHKIVKYKTLFIDFARSIEERHGIK